MKTTKNARKAIGYYGVLTLIMIVIPLIMGFTLSLAIYMLQYIISKGFLVTALSISAMIYVTIAFKGAIILPIAAPVMGFYKLYRCKKCGTMNAMNTSKEIMKQGFKHSCEYCGNEQIFRS